MVGVNDSPLPLIATVALFFKLLAYKCSMTDEQLTCKSNYLDWTTKVIMNFIASVHDSNLKFFHFLYYLDDGNWQQDDA